MSEEKSETEFVTLNFSYLRAALDEASSKSKTGPMGWEAPLPDEVGQQQDEVALSAQAVHAAPPKPADRSERIGEPLGRAYGSLREDESEPVDLWEKSKAAIADKKAEIARVREAIDRFSKGSDDQRQADIKLFQEELNDLRLKRLAIQMALVADSSEYDEADILAIDQRMKELVEWSAQARKPKAADAGEELSGLRAQEESLVRELRKLIAGHNRRVVVSKAEAYLQALKIAHRLQHEWLALIELSPGDGPLRHLDLGGELPSPKGFDTLVPGFSSDLAISLAGIEEAKARLRSELAF